jgi:hypothetical protein
MLTYFGTANGKEFLRRLKGFQDEGKLTVIRRIVIMPNTAKDGRFAAFAQLHRRLGWELRTIQQNNLAEIMPTTLQSRVNPDALDAALYGKSYVCEASPASRDGDMSKLVWVHEEEIVKIYEEFFNELTRAAKLEIAPPWRSTRSVDYDQVYNEFEEACAVQKKSIIR